MHGMSLSALGESLDVCLELNHCYENCGLVRDLNSGPLAPEARIIPLDQRAGDVQTGNAHETPMSPWDIRPALPSPAVWDWFLLGKMLYTKSKIIKAGVLNLLCMCVVLFTCVV
jgi:hypothetical protein